MFVYSAENARIGKLIVVMQLNKRLTFRTFLPTTSFVNSCQSVSGHFSNINKQTSIPQSWLYPRTQSGPSIDTATTVFGVRVGLGSTKNTYMLFHFHGVLVYGNCSDKKDGCP